MAHDPDTVAAAPVTEARRLRITGLHHVTLLCADLRRSVAFYSELLGLAVVAQTVNEDDTNARHLFFGDEDGSPGTLITCLEYPQMEEGSVGLGSTHHFALGVDSADELEGWRRHFVGHGIACTEVLDRAFFSSIYLRDPDGHIVELATRGPGVMAPPGEPGAGAA